MRLAFSVLLKTHIVIFYKVMMALLVNAVLSDFLLASSSLMSKAKVPSLNSEAPEHSHKNKTAERFGDFVHISGQTLFRTQAGCQTSPSSALATLTQNTPEILLLSGPTDHWHSDSGWFALLQPLLGESYCVWTIDRPGHGFSSTNKPLSYLNFGKSLNQLAKQNQWQNVLLVSFASSNISVHQILNQPDYSSWIAGAVLVDPDILLPHSIAQYSRDARPFRDNFAKYQDYIRAGKYAQRAKDIGVAERKHIESILPDTHQHKMDWDYYDAIARQRQTTDRLLARFAEISGYQDDLEGAAKLKLPDDFPLVIINTDFESNYIEALTQKSNATSDKQDTNEQINGLTQWRNEGNQWMETLTRPKHRKYIPLDSREHLLPIANPDIIVESVAWLTQQTQEKITVRDF